MQAQVGDIGLMGAPAKLDGKAVEGVKIFLGGRIGENPEVGVWVQACMSGPRGACCHMSQRPPCVMLHLHTLTRRGSAMPKVHIHVFILSFFLFFHSLQLAKEFERGIPVDESVLLPRLRELLISEFGATPRQPAAAPTAAASTGQAAAEPAGAAA